MGDVCVQGALWERLICAQGARGLCNDPLWGRCVDLLWVREAFFIPGMSCAPGALRLAFVYHFILTSGTVSWPGLSFSAFVWCSPSVNFVLIRSGSERPLHRSALGAKCRFALGARGLFINPLWVRCVDPLWGRELPRVRGLREQLLASGSVTFRDMQSFIGKCGSLSLVFPAFNLFARECRLLLRLLDGASQGWPSLVLREIPFTRFINSFSEPVPWRGKQHLVLQLSLGASGFV